MIDQNPKAAMTVSGSPVSSGIAIGPAFILKHINLGALSKNRFPIEDLAMELERLDKTIKKTHSQLHQMTSQCNSDVAAIIKVQMSILADNSFMQDIVTIVKEEKSNIEYVLSNQIKLLEAKFGTIENDYMRSKILDIQDVYHRILRNLLDIDHVGANSLKRITSPVVLVAQKLLPSDIGLLNPDKLLGILLEEGNILSHVGIMANSLGIPTIMQIPGACSFIKQNDLLIVDAQKGLVVINPADKELALYQTRQKRLVSSGVPHESTRAVACKTSDGTRIYLEANIGSLREAEEANANHADGIGLLRTELFYLSSSSMPSIEEEQDFYVQVAKTMPLFGTTVRLLDLGADKLLPCIESYREENPQLGVRGIRYLLKNTDLFGKHLTAVLRSCKVTPLKILIPFVTSVSDVATAHDLIRQICQKERIDRTMYKLGIMAEIPAVAIFPECFFPHIDFINIGTNDLMQYVFAAGRDESNVEEYRQQSHPVLLKIIKNILEIADKESKEVSICGEIAGNPALAQLLVGLGARKLSMQPSSIPAVRKSLHQAALVDLNKKAGKAIDMRTC